MQYKRQRVQDCHLAFLELFSEKKMVWPFFIAFMNVAERSIFLGLLWKNLSKTCKNL
jgi:hypothetical protein